MATPCHLQGRCCLATAWFVSEKRLHAPIEWPTEFVLLPLQDDLILTDNAVSLIELALRPACRKACPLIKEHVAHDIIYASLEQIPASVI